jgi:peptidoglycan hydrolase-like protein with peptidoglycan-binding domain
MSVGQGGRNALPQDVMTVQYLLNCVPSGRGGPAPELAVDGIAGPKTLAAIRAFQQRHMTSPDGRIDPGGPTLALLSGYDPYPDLPLPLAAMFPKSPSGDKQAGYKGDPLSPGAKKQGFGPYGDKSGFGDKSVKQGFGDNSVKQGFGPPGYKSGFANPPVKQGFGTPGQKTGIKTPGGIKGPGGYKSGW